MKMGYAFHWMHGKLPFMVTPKQGFVHLQVKDDIPYLVSDGELRSNRHRPTINDLKEHFSKVLALVTNDEADQDDDGDNDVIPAAAGESAEVEGEHHHGAFDFASHIGGKEAQQTSGQTYVVIVMLKLTRKRLMRMIQTLESKLMCTKGHQSRGKRGVLNKNANSVAHLPRRYRNPFCESCVKAKMRHFRSRTGAFKREVKTFGDLVT